MSAESRMNRREQHGGQLGPVEILIIALVALVIALFSAPSVAADWGTGKWTLGNTALQSGIVGLDAMAAKQTRDCMRLPYCRETGMLATALYGPRPSVNEVWKFFLLKTLVKGLFAYHVDSPTREAVQVVFLAGGAFDVRHNQREGLPPDPNLLFLSLSGIGIHWAFF